MEIGLFNYLEHFFSTTPLNGGHNYNSPKVAKFLVCYKFNRLKFSLLNFQFYETDHICIYWTLKAEVFSYLFQYDTKYYYAVGIGNTVRQFWFTTPPKVGPDVSYTFGLIGILVLLVHLFVPIVILGCFCSFGCLIQATC